MWNTKGSNLKGKGFSGNGYGKGMGMGRGKGNGFVPNVSGYGYGNHGFGQKGGGKAPPQANWSTTSYNTTRSQNWGPRTDDQLKPIDQQILDDVFPVNYITSAEAQAFVSSVTSHSKPEDPLRSLIQKTAKRYCNLALSAVQNSRDRTTNRPLLDLQNSKMGHPGMESGIYCLTAISNTRKNLCFEEVEMWLKYFHKTRDSEMHLLDKSKSFMTFTDFLMLPENVAYWNETGRREVLTKLGANRYSILYKGYYNDPHNCFVTANGKHRQTLHDYYDLNKPLDPPLSCDTGFKHADFSNLVATITALVVQQFQDDENSQKDKESISVAVSKAVSAALKSPSKPAAPNADGADEHATKKAKRNLSMGDSSSSTNQSSSPDCSTYFDKLNNANEKNDAESELHERRTVKLTALLAHYNSVNSAIPIMPVENDTNKRKAGALVVTVDFTVDLYKLMDADTDLDAEKTRKYCEELSISYPAQKEANKGCNCKQNAMMKIAILCWNLYSSGCTSEPEIKVS